MRRQPSYMRHIGRTAVGVHGAGGQNQEARKSDPRLRKSKKKVNWNISGRFLSRMVLKKEHE